MIYENGVIVFKNVYFKLNILIEIWLNIVKLFELYWEYLLV